MTLFKNIWYSTDLPVDNTETLLLTWSDICLPSLYQWTVGGGDPAAWQLNKNTLPSPTCTFALGLARIFGLWPFTLQQTTPVMSRVWWQAVWKWASTQQLESIRPPEIQEVWPTYLCGQSRPMPARSSYEEKIRKSFMWNKLAAELGNVCLIFKVFTVIYKSNPIQWMNYIYVFIKYRFINDERFIFIMDLLM